MWELKLYRDKYYAYAKIDGKSIRRSLRTSDKSLAIQAFEDFKERNKRPEETIEDVFESYRVEKDDSKKTLFYIWKNIGPFFKDLRPDQITKELCKIYISQRKDYGVKDGTIIRELGALRSAVKFNDRHSRAEFYLPPPPPPKHRYLTRSEFKKLIDAADEPHIRLYIILGLCTAARKSAILGLKWHQVDFERGLINFGTGNNIKGRAIVPINPTLERALEKHYKSRTTDYVIEYGTRPLKDIKRGFSTAVIKAGLKDVSPHVLRHTAAVWMAENRTPMSEISQFLGHKTTRTTEAVYARYSPEYLKNPAKALDFEGFN